MPWHIETDRPDCDGYAVVKDEGSELVGCHRTRTQALAQLAALNIAEPQKDRAAPAPEPDEPATPNLTLAREMLAQLHAQR
jgi:hypothetical protein